MCAKIRNWNYKVKYLISIFLKLFTDVALLTQLDKEFETNMLRLGFAGCRSLLFLVAWSYKSAFLVKYCVRYFGTTLFKYLRTRIHLYFFLLETRFNQLRCFDKVFQRPYRYFLIPLKVVFSLSDCYKIFTSNWPWIEICENVVLSKIDITMTTINKKLWNW